ncbi:MAG TPA: alpha/beta hydrolase [Anaerolineales bacterium]|nr:alpha/beta hydrolase [Anaerolineales bacterium]
MLQSGEYTFTANGLKLWYKVSGNGPVCVMPTPGWGSSSDIYFLSLQKLDEFFTMVYLDTRGSGRSERPPTPQDYTYEQFASDLDALRQHLGQEQILVLGHSQGGVHAMQYALRYPEGCRGLILADSFPAFDAHLSEDMQKNAMKHQQEPWFETAFEALNNEEEIQNEAEYKEYIEAILPFYLVDQEVPKRYADAFETGTFSLEAMKGQEAVQLTVNLLPELHKIDIPTLIVVGSDDFICSPLQSERIHFGIKNSKLIVIQNSGHFPWMEQPEQFYARVKAGLDVLNLIQPEISD